MSKVHTEVVYRDYNYSVDFEHSGDRVKAFIIGPRDKVHVRWDPVRYPDAAWVKERRDLKSKMWAAGILKAAAETLIPNNAGKGGNSERLVDEPWVSQGIVDAHSRSPHTRRLPNGQEIIVRGTIVNEHLIDEETKKSLWSRVSLLNKISYAIGKPVKSYGEAKKLHRDMFGDSASNS